MRTPKKVDQNQLNYYAQVSLVSTSLLLLLIALFCLWNLPSGVWRMGAAISIIPSLLLFSSAHIIAVRLTEFVTIYSNQAPVREQMPLRKKLDDVLQRRTMKAMLKKLPTETI